MAAGYTPAWQVSANGIDVTTNLDERLVSLTVTDAEGIKSDTCDIVIDDKDGEVAIPPKGSKLSVSIGYRETGLSFMGTYIVDEVRVSFDQEGRRMKITGHAADMRETLKEHRTKGYENKTILEIVTDIAGRHGLTPAVNAQIGAFVNDYVAQQGESDMHFLTRLAKRHDCIFKVANGRLIFVPRGEAASASGLSMPNVTITPDMVKAYEATFKDRPAFQKTYATWWDRKKAKLNKEESDDQQNDETSGESAVDADFGVRHQHPNKDVAKATANAKQAENDKDTRTMTITVYGDAEIRAEATLTVQGVRDRVNDQWRVKQVTHSIMNESGFLSIVDCEKPGNGAIGN